uniref:Ubiquitin carboxyl-terminal hydrolase n=1 Tax=Callorhinchus milii TaxID=7868 RepID=A0A4W3JZ80_CALMI
VLPHKNINSNNIYLHSEFIFFPSGSACQHIITSVDLIEVKKAVAQNHWSVCSECVRDLKAHDGEPEISPDIWMCLKCGYQGCSRNSEDQHSLKHSQATRSDPHCIVINLESWSIWCYECNEEPAQCNKKALAQALDFLQKHAIKTGLTSKPLKVREEISDGSETIRGKHPVNNVTAPVKGLSNLGNTCFFNAVMQNLAQTHMLSELLNEMKEKETKLKISPPTDSNLDPLMIILPSPGSLTSAMYLFLHSMKEAGKGPVTPRLLFNQLCQKAPWFKGFQQQDSQELLHYLLDALKIEETKRIQSGILKAFNNPTVKTADEETKRKVKVYGKEGVKMNFVDQIFVGELINIIMCEECSHISTVKEPFIDLSLPIIEERIYYLALSANSYNFLLLHFVHFPCACLCLFNLIFFVEKKPEPVYTNARKQMLITAVPPVLNLHLKRFHQAGLSLRKVNRHVDFPLVLDLAPFCSSNCKNVGEGNQVLYSLYGIVEHCGSMRGGHYIAYVKYRIPNKKLFERIACSKNNSGFRDAVAAQPGQWVYVSDVHVQTVPESRVLNAQAYLLFYERLL